MPESISKSVFGNSGDARSYFSVGVRGKASESEKAAQSSIQAAKREINRIRGYKLDLTPADNKKLADIQKRIQVIEKKANEGTIRQDEIDERGKLYRDADIVLGKPSADVEIDDTLREIREKIDTLLAPKLSGARGARVELLKKVKEHFAGQLEDGGGDIVRKQFQNVSRQIAELTPPRQISQLSVTERKEYDKLVEQANKHAGAKLVLNARDTQRVYNLQKTIDDLTSALPPDYSGQPTPASVSRAYARLK